MNASVVEDTSVTVPEVMFTVTSFRTAADTNSVPYTVTLKGCEVFVPGTAANRSTFALAPLRVNAVTSVPKPWLPSTPMSLLTPRMVAKNGCVVAVLCGHQRASTRERGRGRADNGDKHV